MKVSSRAEPPAVVPVLHDRESGSLSDLGFVGSLRVSATLLVLPAGGKTSTLNSSMY
jgi:hypothetical protein